MAESTISETVLSLPCLHRGDTCEVYELPINRCLIVFTDNASISSLCILRGISNKGKQTNQISIFWIKLLRDKSFNISKDHLETDDLNGLSCLIGQEQIMDNDLVGRSMIVKRYKMLPVRCLVSNYLTINTRLGYRKLSRATRAILKIGNLKKSEKLPEPIVVMSFKNDSGEYEYLPTTKMIDRIDDWLIENMPTCQTNGAQIVFGLIAKSRGLYIAAYQFAYGKEIIIAETEFEYGLTIEGEAILAGEVLTPVLSCYWLKEEYESGVHQKSWHVKPISEYFNNPQKEGSLKPLALPLTVVTDISLRYKTLLERLTK